MRFWAFCSYWYNKLVQAVVALKLLTLEFTINGQWDRVTDVTISTLRRTVSSMTGELHSELLVNLSDNQP